MKYECLLYASVVSQPCDCNYHPLVISSDLEYSAVWLQCPNCGKRTPSFYSNKEGNGDKAKFAAIDAWNNGNRFTFK